MKSKLTMKLLGIVVTIATLASLLVGITAAPVSAAAGALAYNVIDTPSLAGKVMVEGNQMSFMVANTDGSVIFAYDATNFLMYKSTNSGASFSKISGTTFAGTAVGMAISPTFATDSTVVLATTTKVYYSTNAGSAWVDCAPADLTTKIEGGVISSVDVGTYFADSGVLSILVGVVGHANVVYNNVLKFKFGSFSWDEVGAAGTFATHDVYAVRYSPNHLSDVTILAVYDDGAQAYLAAKVGTFAWGFASYPDVKVVAAAIATATIGLSGNFAYSAGAPVLVGVTGAGAGLYYVKSTDNPTAIDAGVAVNSISVVGDSYATVYYGRTTDNKVYKSTTVGTSTVSFAGTSTCGTGTFGTTVAARGTNVYATSMGADGGFSVSTDGAGTFYQTALMNVTLANGLSLYDIQAVNNNTMFLLMQNTTGFFYLFKTTNGGVAWQRIKVITAATSVLLSVSATYATDTTLAYTADNSAIVYKSVNGGTSFSAVPTPAAAVWSLQLGASGSIYAGDVAGFFKVGRWTNATGITAGSKVVNIAINPKDATGATIAVGTDKGEVFISTDDGASFSAVVTATGAIAGGPAEPMLVAYAPDGTLYSMGTTGTAIKRLDSTTSKWTADVEAVALGNAIDIGADGTMYATDATNGIGIYRSLTPAAAAPEFYAMSSTNFASLLGPTGADSHGKLSKQSIVSTAADNTIYSIDTDYGATLANYTYGYKGRLVGFDDTFITAPAQTTPATGALVTTTTTADVSWTAFTGAKYYQVNVNTKADFSGTAKDPTNTTSTTATAPATGTLSEGATYNWRVRAASTNSTNTFLSRWSSVRTFITALSTPGTVTIINPTNGATDVAVDTTFTWPTVAGATYEFVIAEELGNVDKFAIIDYSATCPTNATVLRETLKYNTTYWWRVRAVTAISKSDWSVEFFTTEKAPVVTSSTAPVPPVTITTTNFTVTNPPQTTFTITQPTATPPASPIPPYLLWAVIAVGAILVIAVIVLIVRTRKI